MKGRICRRGVTHFVTMCPFTWMHSSTYQCSPVPINALQYLSMLSSTYQCSPVLINALQYLSMLSNTYQCSPAPINALQYLSMLSSTYQCTPVLVNALQYLPMHSSTYQCTPVPINALQYLSMFSSAYQCTPAPINALQYLSGCIIHWRNQNPAKRLRWNVFGCKKKNSNPLKNLCFSLRKISWFYLISWCGNYGILRSVFYDFRGNRE